MLENQSETNIATKARQIAISAFERAGVKRKYPIEKHLDEVVEDLEKVGFPVEVIAAAYLHDAPAYTDLSVNKIKELFGETIGNMVEEVFASAVMGEKNIQIRKQKQADLMGTASNEAKAIKIADQRSNILQGFNGTADKEATVEEKKAYLEGARVVALACHRNGNKFVQDTFNLFEETYNRLINELN